MLQSTNAADVAITILYRDSSRSHGPSSRSMARLRRRRSRPAGSGSAVVPMLS